MATPLAPARDRGGVRGAVAA